MYSDPLIEITPNLLIIKDYYFPGVSKEIALRGILKVQVLEPGLLTGQLRIWGMGLRPVWFAIDWKRPWRDAIFVVYHAHSWPASGFTAESSENVIRALKERGVEVEELTN